MKAGPAAATVAAFAAMIASGVWSQQAHRRLTHDSSVSGKGKTTIGIEDANAVVKHSFWEIRRSLAVLTWNEAQTYFHSGFDLASFARNQKAEERILSEGTEHDHGDHSNCAHDHEAGHEQAEHETDEHAGHDDDHDHTHENDMGVDLHGKADQLKIKSLRDHPFLKRSALRPYVFSHQETREGAERMMPFYWLTTKLDPNFTKAYAGGAFWLAFRFHRVEQAVQYLDEGIKANPDAYEIYQMKGRIAFSIRKDWKQSVEVFEKAFAANRNYMQLHRKELDKDREANEAVKGDGLEILRYLARSYLNLGDEATAIRLGYAGLRLEIDATGFGAVISDATVALAKELSTASDDGTSTSL